MNVRDSAKVVAATTEIEILINYNSQSFPRRGLLVNVNDIANLTVNDHHLAAH